jgi:hypothetical protein
MPPTLFRLDCLMQTVSKTATRHHTAREFVDQNDFVTAYNVIFVLGEQLVRLQCLTGVVHQRDAFGIIQRLSLWQQASAGQCVL